MMEQHLISIIIPIYNAEKYIGECLLSLIEQTYKNIEILCVDDCSKDNSVQIIKELQKKDARIKLFQHETNKGPAGARNTALEQANGEYIMFCDNDDTYKLNMCEKMLGAIIRENADLVACRADVKNIHIDKPLADYMNSQPIGKYCLCNKMKKHINVLVWNKIYKKSIIDEYRIAFPETTAYEDVGFVFAYTAVSKNYYGLEDKLYNYVFRDSSFTFTKLRGKSKKIAYEGVKILEYCYNFFEKYDLLEKHKDFFRHIIDIVMSYGLKYNKNFFVKKEILRKYAKFISKTIFKKEERVNNIFDVLRIIKQCYWF